MKPETKKWGMFIHEKVSPKATAVSNYPLDMSLEEAKAIVRDVVLARAYTSGNSVKGRLYCHSDNALLPTYECQSTLRAGKLTTRRISKQS